MKVSKEVLKDYVNGQHFSRLDGVLNKITKMFRNVLIPIIISKNENTQNYLYREKNPR